MKTKQERIAALIASKKNTFAEAHSAFLETLNDEQLAKLEEADAAVAEPVTPAPVAAPKVETPAVAAQPKTLEQQLAEMHPDVARQVRRGLAAEKAQKDAVISRIKANAKNTFTDAQLSAFDLEQLNSVAALAGVEPSSEEPVTFVRPTAIETLRDNANDAPDAPLDMAAQIKAARGQ